MKPDADLFDRDGLERLLEAAERDQAASEELDFLADLVAAAELERARLARKAAPLPKAEKTGARPWMLAAAASVLFLLGLGAWFLGHDGPALTSLAALDPPRFVASELRDPDSALDGFARTMEPYVRADWAAATLALEEWLRARPDHGPAHFYLGAAREQLGELDAAEEHYEAARRAPDELLSEHARFRLAVLLFRHGELERARTELAVLQSSGGELARNARELLGELEK